MKSEEIKKKNIFGKKKEEGGVRSYALKRVSSWVPDKDSDGYKEYIALKKKYGGDKAKSNKRKRKHTDGKRRI